MKYVGFYCNDLVDKCILHEEDWFDKSNDLQFYIINSNNVHNAKDKLFEVIYNNDLVNEKKNKMSFYALNFIRYYKEEDIFKIFGEIDGNKIIEIISLFPENKEDICKHLIPEQYQDLSQETLKILTRVYMDSDLKVYKLAKEL